MNKNITIGILAVIIIALAAVLIFKPKGQEAIVPIDNDPITTIPTNPAQPAITTTLPTYVGGQEGWPPVITHSATAYSCTPHTTGTDLQTITVQKTINSRVYCVTSMDEGAAGSTYRNWTYTTAATNGTGTETTHFVLRYVNCDNYRDNTPTGGATYNQCKADQSGFDVDAVVDSLM